MIVFVKKFSSTFQGHSCIKSAATSIIVLCKTPAEPWSSSEVIVLEIKYHHRAGSRISELPRSVTHPKSKQLKTAREEKGYKIKALCVSKTEVDSWHEKQYPEKVQQLLFLLDICDEVTSQPEQRGRFALMFSLSGFSK